MRIKSILIAILVFSGVMVKANNQISTAEAMFIYNFLRHIEWPQGSSQDVFVIGVFGETDTYNELLSYTANRKVGTKKIEVRKLSSPNEAKACQVVFVPNKQASEISQIKSVVGNSPCLIVGEREGSNSKGANIEFVIQDSKLRFRVDAAKSSAQNLSISRALIDMSI